MSMLNPSDVIDLLNTAEFYLARGRYTDILLPKKCGIDVCDATIGSYNCIGVAYLALKRYSSPYIFNYQGQYFYREISSDIEFNIVKLYYNLLDSITIIKTIKLPPLNPNYVEL